MTDMTKEQTIEVETVQETILELLTTNSVVQELVQIEVGQRFPNGHPTEMADEITCMVQILVYNRILNGIVS